jgi:hypothetical protein
MWLHGKVRARVRCLAPALPFQITLIQEKLCFVTYLITVICVYLLKDSMKKRYEVVSPELLARMPGILRGFGVRYSELNTMLQKDIFKS